MTHQTCIFKYRPPNTDGTYMIVHQPMPDEVASLAGFDYLGLLNSISVSSLGNQRFKNHLDIKLIKIADDAAILYSVSSPMLFRETQ